MGKHLFDKLPDHLIPRDQESFVGRRLNDSTRNDIHIFKNYLGSIENPSDWLQKTVKDYIKIKVENLQKEENIGEKRRTKPLSKRQKEIEERIRKVRTKTQANIFLVGDELFFPAFKDHFKQYQKSKNIRKLIEVSGTRGEFNANSLENLFLDDKDPNRGFHWTQSSAWTEYFDTDQVKNKKIFIHYGATSFGHTYESKVIKYQSGVRTTARSRYVLSEDLFEENALRIDSSVEKAIKDNPARLIRHNFKTEVEDKLHIFLYELFSISGIYLNFVSTKRKDVDKAWNRLKDVINAVSKHTKELEKLEAKNHKKAYDFRKPIRIRGRAFREMQLCERQVYLYEILTDNLEQFKKLINPYRSYTLGFYKVLSDTEAENLAQTCTSIINSIYLCSNLFTAQQARNINKKIKDNKEAIHIISCPYNCLPYLTGFIHFEETSVMNVSSHLNTNTNMLYYNMEAFCKYFNAYREYKWTDTEKAERGVIKRLEKMGKIKKVFG